MTENEAIERLKCMRLFMEISDKQNENKFLEDDYIANKIAIQALEEIQQYRAIGTIEELKDLKEKSVAKKPIVKGLMAIDDRRYYCPKCNERLYREHFDVGYCNCGQSIRT